MARGKSVQIGDHVWQYQKDAIEYFKTILNSYSIGDTLLDEDFDDVYSLLKNHPDAKHKIRGGIESIFVGADEYGGQCFHVLRRDGSKENFSYRKSISGEANPFTLFSKACRKAVEPDMIKVKEDYFSNNSNAKCQETNELITVEQSHVDHRQPNTFSVIVDRFIELNDIGLDAVEYISEGQYGRIFRDNSLAERFRSYHKQKANLRVVSKDLNLRRSFMARTRTQKKDLRIS